MSRKIGRQFRRNWVPIVIIIALTIGGFTVNSLRGIFGAELPGAAGNTAGEKIVSTNPKQVSYEVFGPSDATGMISYLDEHAQPQQANFSTLPWTFAINTTVPSVLATITAQGDSRSLGCRITVNGEIRDEQTADSHDAMAYCLVKAA